MKIEKHNSHGMELVVTMTLDEADDLIAKVSGVAATRAETDLNTYVSIPCQFEDDNNRWVATDFTLMVEGDPVKSENAGCQAAFPCGKPVEQMGSIPAGPCDLQEGHEDHCYRRNTKLDYHI